MDEGRKPFACIVEGCDMTFTNEDHLNWHRKKHDMVLNLEVANKNSELADQTPTPTRFIRNCEEVGLFQDLQNVNPFDEFFKKAVEITKAGGTLEVHEINSDDTLHTPHILPHIEESRKRATPTSTLNEDDNLHPEFTLNNVIMGTGNCNEKTVIEQNNEPIMEISEQTDNLLQSGNINNNSLVINNTQEGQQINRNDVKLKIKQNLQIRRKLKNASANETIKNIVITDPRPKEKMLLSSDSPSLAPITKEKIRAMNRAAQVRCRRRKAQRWKEMEEELDHLKLENKKLKLENSLLKKELIGMGSTLTTENLNKNIEAESSQNFQEAISNSGTDNSNSFIIKILPNTSTLIPLGILPKETRDNIGDNQKELAKSKNLRKIIPKIVIDNC